MMTPSFLGNFGKRNRDENLIETKRR